MLTRLFPTLRCFDTHAPLKEKRTKALSAHYRDILNEEETVNPKTFWKTIKSISTNQRNIQQRASTNLPQIC